MSKAIPFELRFVVNPEFNFLGDKILRMVSLPLLEGKKGPDNGTPTLYPVKKTYKQTIKSKSIHTSNHVCLQNSWVRVDAI